jgi:hypothetical protein
MNRRSFITSLIAFAGAAPLLAQSGFDWGSLTLSDAKISQGLREALQVGTDNAVKLVGRENGYFGNAVIKILMPKNLRTFERGLRAIGYGSQVDEFVLGMNRAAEKAAPQAKRIFRDAILQMSINDARNILAGGSDTAATEYFKEKTSGELTTTFTPVVQDSMNQVGVTRQYRELIGRYKNIPFVSSPKLDLDSYVVGKALDGLFYMVGQEEKKIRTNPAARVTDLLKQVFRGVGR